MIEQKRVDGAFVIGALYPKNYWSSERTCKCYSNGRLFSDVSDFSQNDYVESISMAVDYLIQKDTIVLLMYQAVYCQMHMNTNCLVIKQYGKTWDL